MEAAAPSCFDMEGLGRPRVTDAHVASFVKEKFGLPITDIKALAGERDLNYRATAGGKPYVIKVANASEVYGQLECENQVMVHVAKQLELDDTLTEALLTPRPLELSDGSGTIGKISSQAGPATEYLIRVLTFIEGDMWSGTTLAVDFLASLGRTVSLRRRRAPQRPRTLSSPQSQPTSRWHPPLRRRRRRSTRRCSPSRTPTPIATMRGTSAAAAST